MAMSTIWFHVFTFVFGVHAMMNMSQSYVYHRLVACVPANLSDGARLPCYLARTDAGCRLSRAKPQSSPTNIRYRSTCPRADARICCGAAVCVIIELNSYMAHIDVERRRRGEDERREDERINCSFSL